MPAQAQEKIPGFPEGAQILALEKFGSLNTKASRQAIEDQEFSWLENWMPIGDGNLRTLYAEGTSIYTAPNGRTILFMFFYNIGSTQYAIVFLDNGTADQVNVNTQAVTHVSTTPNTFYNGGSLPDVQQWGSTGIVIVGSASSSCYFAWDGGVLYSPNNAAPTWLSGLANPLSPTGNTHSNTTIDTISSMTGIEVGMSVTGTGIPANTVITAVNVAGSSITISNAASSSSTGITLTITWAMPTGVSGTGIEIYQSRAWIINGAKLFFSAPSNGANFGADGGGSITSNDAFLKQGYQQIRQSNSFLYLFGDSSINSISNVQTSGSPAVTTFNNLNADPQVGTPWHGTVWEFGRYLMMANTSGVYGVLGGAAQKISDKLDGLFAASSLPLTGATLPSAAVATVFGIKVYVLLIPGAVDYQGKSRPLMAIWDEKKWFIASQIKTLTYIVTQEVSSNLTAWGTDGTNLFPLFQTANPSLNKVMQGKLWAGESYLYTKQSLAAYIQLQDNAGTSPSATLSVDTEKTSVSAAFSSTNNVQFVNDSGGAIQFQNNSGGNINFSVPSDSFIEQGISNYGQLLGLTLTTTAQDATLISASLLYKNYRGLY